MANDESSRTASGKVLTDAELQRLADEAEAGYEATSLGRPRIVPVGMDVRLAQRAAARARTEGVRMHVIIDRAVLEYLGDEDLPGEDQV